MRTAAVMQKQSARTHRVRMSNQSITVSRPNCAASYNGYGFKSYHANNIYDKRTMMQVNDSPVDC